MMVIFSRFSRSLVVGRSACGKSVLVDCIIKQRAKLFETSIDQVLYVSPSPVASITSNVTFLTDIPKELPQNSLIIVDDSAMDRKIMKKVAELCIRQVHHTNSHLILIVQKLYIANDDYRLAMEQMTYLILFRMVKGFYSLSRIVNDIFPSNLRGYFWSSYKAATSKSYGHLLIDISGEKDMNKCLFTNICDNMITYDSVENCAIPEKASKLEIMCDNEKTVAPSAQKNAAEKPKIINNAVKVKLTNEQILSMLKKRGTIVMSNGKIKNNGKFEKGWDKAGLIKFYRQNIHLLKTNTCNICNRGFSSNSSLNRHISIHNEQRFTCTKCNKHYSQQTYLNLHVRKCIDT
jgi:hypothetical protein